MSEKLIGRLKDADFKGTFPHFPS